MCNGTYVVYTVSQDYAEEFQGTLLQALQRLEPVRNRAALPEEMAMMSSAATEVQQQKSAGSLSGTCRFDKPFRSLETLQQTAAIQWRQPTLSVRILI